jgi:hypothetical protein
MTRETAIRRDARGQWWNGPDPITHALLVRAFDAWIDVADDGRYCLKNDINWAYVAIEGAPVFVRSCRLEAGAAHLSLSDGRVEPLDAATLREGPDGALYCDVRGGKLRARFDPHAAMQLGEALDPSADGPVLRLGGGLVRVPVVADPLARR